jgi:N-ethylmaleimide reductase
MKVFREMCQETMISNVGYTRSTGNAIVEAGTADLVSFGKLFLANPDLPHRFACGAPLNSWDFSTFYGTGERGYTDYPAWAEGTTALR